MACVKRIVGTSVSALKNLLRSLDDDDVEGYGVDLRFTSQIDEDVIMLVLLKPIKQSGVVKFEAALQCVMETHGTDQPRHMHSSPWCMAPYDEPWEEYSTYQHLFSTTVLANNYSGDSEDLDRVADFQVSGLGLDLKD